MFQWIICGEKGAFKMEGTSFAVQMMPPKLYVSEAPEDGATKGIYESREGGPQWKEVEVPESKLGCFGVAEVYEGIAKGKGIEDVSLLFLLLLFISCFFAQFSTTFHFVSFIFFAICRKLPMEIVRLILWLLSLFRVSLISTKRSRDTRWSKRLPKVREMGRGRIISDDTIEIHAEGRRNGRNW